jgi:hypothetical protein
MRKKSIIRMLFLIHFLSVSLASFAQNSDIKKEKKDKFPSYFGLQFKPLIAGNFLGSSQLKLNNEQFYAVINQKFGYSFGANVRIGLTKLISLETGINQVVRNYNIDYSIPDSNLYVQNDIGFLNYDIPLNALIYIQLSDKIFMNASLGGSMVYNPTDVATKLALQGGNVFIQEGRRFSKLAFEMNANFGAEYRTEKNGIFYVGISGRIPVKPIYEIAAVYERQSYIKKATGNLIGTYISFDFRYYLPNIKNKGVQFIPGPIDQ